LVPNKISVILFFFFCIWQMKGFQILENIYHTYSKLISRKNLLSAADI